MKKRTLAMLLALVLVISIVPATALASDGCEHCYENGYYGYSYNNDNTHDVYCKGCGKILSEDAGCVFNEETGKCYSCGGTKVAPHDCWTDNNLGYCFNGDNTHDVYCKTCGETLSEDAECVFNEETGKCYACGGTKIAAPECDHVGKKYTYTDNEDGTHTVTCECGHSWTAECVWETGECICGSTKPAAPECDHVGKKYEYTDNEDGTHKVTCECGKVLNESAACVWEAGKCACGSTKPSCDHVGKKFTYTDNQNGTHKVTCECGEVISKAAECVWETGKCVCGSTESTCDHMGNHWDYVGNGDGTHDVVCKDCTEVVTPGMEHYFIDGKCICGAVEASCDHMGNHWHYEDNKDGTHKVICEDCKETVTENAACVYTDGVCLACGAKEPKKTPADNTGLDSVPKTGDNGSIIVMGAVAVLALFGGAYIFTKKRAF